MNITAYSEKKGYEMPLGMAILKGDYYIASADEFFYSYLDKHSDRRFTELIHPEDISLFEEAAAKLDEGTQYVLVRFLTMELHYKYMLLRLRPDKFVIDGIRCIEVYIADIIEAMEKHRRNRVILTKYRRMMSIVDYIFFDYEKKKNKINIYMYANDKAYMFLSEDLDVWYTQMMSSYLWKDSEKQKFETLYSCIKDGLDDFKIQLATTFFSKAKRSDSILVTGSVLFDTEGNKLVAGVIKLSSDEMEKPYYTTEASKDSATGLMNKRAIMEYSAHKIRESGDKQLALMVLDIDDFKTINDTYGHLFGDQVIFKIAETLKRIVSVRGMVARFGGDEFVVLLENCDNYTMNNMLKTIYGEVGLMFKDIYEDIHVTISTGISGYPKDGMTYEELFQKADKALYIAKANGKNNAVFYDEDTHKDVEVVNERQRMKGLKSIGSRVNRSMLYSEIILELAKDGKSALADVVGKICDLFDVAGITVFVGKELKTVLRYGKYNCELERFTLMEHEDFVEMISADDMVIVDDIIQLRDKSFYDKYKRVEVNANLLSIYRQDGVVKSLVSFDVFNTSRQWSEQDMISLNAIGKLICQKVCEE